MLTVYKASAGSGKTFQLVAEYLKLILENPLNYKHILAVTFTNKATNEMKSRILEQLYLLSSKKESAYLKLLQQESNYTELFIRQQAKQTLKNILHDYNRFSVNTIDSFTQKVIKSFNRELGITPNFTVELDNDIILEEATDRMLAKISEDKDLLQWLREFSREKLESNRSQRIDDDIKNLGRELFKENFQVFFQDESKANYNRKNLSSFGKELQSIKNKFETTLQKKAKELFTEITNSNFSVDDFSYKKTGVAGYIESIASGVIKKPGQRVLTASEQVEKWYSTKHKQAAEIHNLVANKLQTQLNEITHLFLSDFERYNTALAILNQLRMLGILIDLKEEVQLLLQEKGSLQMADSNLLLNKIIGESDSPFIYERIGSFYKHYMLDEFQDTSSLQWKNFKPLLANTLAEGHKSLIVGDVKQSIYRWRNSDWSILAEQLDSDFPSAQKQDFTLEKNWRSDKNIIDFNNAIFGNLKDTFSKYLFNEIEDADASLNKFNKIYEDYRQNPGVENKENKGFAQVNFLPKENFTDESTTQLIEQVKHLQEKGIKAEDTAILIRKNSEGTKIIEAFMTASKQEENKGYNLSVLSNESLFLSASKGVLLVIETIQLLIDPENIIAKASLLQLWQNWLVPKLQINNILNVKEDKQRVLNFKDNEKWYLSSGDLCTIFELELEEKLQQIREKVLLSGLDETITQISSIYGIFNVTSEIPFLQTLIDKAGELKTLLSNDLSNLLLWWQEKGHQTSVYVNDQVNSIRLLTVHKSKGLEYKAVLLPYLDWGTSWSGKNAPILWCKPLSSPFNKFPLLPIRAGITMSESEFKGVYFQEKMNNYIDTLNLLYVAFTRAKSVLIANCPEITEGKNYNSGKAINYLLKKALEVQNSTEIFSNCFDSEKHSFTYGEIAESESTANKTLSTTLNNYHFNNFDERIRLRLSGESFLNNEGHNSAKDIGKLVHEILSEIELESDIENACSKAFNENRITKEELLKIKEILQHNLEEPDVKNWFNGSYKIINERNLLSRNKLLRPDRIMLLGNTAIVVDYKTGEKNNKYKQQVELYSQTLKESGLKKVTGYLWYLSLNKVEKVCER